MWDTPKRTTCLLAHSPHLIPCHLPIPFTKLKKIVFGIFWDTTSSLWPHFFFKYILSVSRCFHHSLKLWDTNRTTNFKCSRFLSTLFLIYSLWWKHSVVKSMTPEGSLTDSISQHNIVYGYNFTVLHKGWEIECVLFLLLWLLLLLLVQCVLRANIRANTTIHRYIISYYSFTTLPLCMLMLLINSIQLSTKLSNNICMLVSALSMHSIILVSHKSILLIRLYKALLAHERLHIIFKPCSILSHSYILKCYWNGQHMQIQCLMSFLMEVGS